MADFLRITTPILDRNAVQPNRPAADPSVPFQLSDITKVIKTDQQTELQGDHNTLVDNQDSPSILMNLLRDPSVTVGFLKNVDMLQQMIKLLPANNTALTQEIELLFQNLLVSPQDIVAELIRQEMNTTTFKGDLFDFLRSLLQQNSKPELRFGVANLLKALNGVEARQSILTSVSNSLSFLADSLSSSQSLSGRLLALAQQFRATDAQQNFTELRSQTLLLLKDVENSLLFTPKLQKITPLIVYNLSRYMDNPDYLREAVGGFSTVVDGDEQKLMLLDLLGKFVQQRGEQGENSRVMDTLADIIQREGQSAELTRLGGDQLEKIIHSLLSSPCNYTPLLHYIVPVQQDDIKAFAEMWIDPNAESMDEKGNRVTDCLHLLAVFDIEGIGRFEAELAASGKDMMINLFCPPAYVNAFADLPAQLREPIASTGYRVVGCKVDILQRQRSLMDVFKSLPYRRTGINVKV